MQTLTPWKLGLAALTCVVMSACASDSTEIPADTEIPNTTNPGNGLCRDGSGMEASSRNLVVYTSADGTSFERGELIQYCADVPSVAQAPSGMLLAAFQGFEDRDVEAEWDRVAVRFSDNGGQSWSDVQFINLEGVPEGSARPFDPTITYDPAGDQWRMFFSMSTSGSLMLDENVCTHSAVSTNGLDYTYEEGARYCAEPRAVIDPAVVELNGMWHYIAPAGAPQDGAHYATSTDGMTFTEGTRITSDMNHNWTGNLTTRDGTLYFYGAEGLNPRGNFLFWASSDDMGASWSDYTSTDVPAGKDPAIVSLQDGSWLMIVPLRQGE